MRKELNSMIRSQLSKVMINKTNDGRESETTQVPLIHNKKKEHTHKQQIDTPYLSKTLILDLFNPTIH